MTQFDLIVLVIILVSAFIGFIRGATRELVTAFSFILALVIALLLLKATGPMGRAIMDPDWLGIGLALVLTFFLAYIALRVIGGQLADRIHRSGGLGSLDRTFGVGIGLVRALVVLGAFNLLYTAATPATRSPQWIKGAALYPLTAASGKMLMAFAPEGQAAAGKIRPAIEKAVREGAGEAPADSELKSADDLVKRPR
ncbi:MAG TPA: CvpA family protein [Caulobacteraceae bacterium]|nr:CvpA family protein [Caulobacteraceae bacterium]